MRSVKPAGTLVRLLTKPGHHLHALEALSLAGAILSDPSPFSPNITDLFYRCLISTGTSVFADTRVNRVRLPSAYLKRDSVNARICVEQTWWTHIRWIATWLKPSCRELVDQRPHYGMTRGRQGESAGYTTLHKVTFGLLVARTM
jgi:hypothetical protein